MVAEADEIFVEEWREKMSWKSRMEIYCKGPNARKRSHDFTL